MASAVDLDKLKAEVTALGEKVKTVKKDKPGSEEAAAAVKELLAAKKKYADNNNGIGVDGKPYQEPLTKAQKKAKAKAEKAAAAAAGGAGDAPKPGGDPNSKNAQKKAANKAAAKAKREAMKKGESPAKAAGGKGPPGKPPAARVFKSQVEDMQIVINPNSALAERPVVALTMAILNNTILDYKLVSDHRSRHSSLGLPGGGVAVGDLAMARYVVRRADGYTPDASKEALVDSLVDYAQSIRLLDKPKRILAIAQTLEHALLSRTFLVGHTLSLADVALFAALDFPAQYADRKAVADALPTQALAARRWVRMMSNSMAVREACQLAVGVAGSKEAQFDDTTLDPLVEGMAYLEGAVAGSVVTRFPPEPSGYLHIGHAKACLLNDYYARRYKGRMILRFDDTNPSKEKEEFQQSIVEDLGKLGIMPDDVTFTSDYLDTIKGYAEKMIKDGQAFMDDTPQEQMQAERLEFKESKHRNQAPDEALGYFKEMCSGSEEGSKWCLRAKIDMSSTNGTMRDPVLYRQNLTPHHRSGTKYKAYPTYDLACPIVDSLEGVTHALRTTEYDARNEQYQWLQTAMKLRRTRIQTFSRVNFDYTVMSKRKLAWFADTGRVTGWDDPRFPTIRGVVRRGINIDSLRAFMYSQGASRRTVNLDWSKFWAENKKEIDKTAKRYMAIDKEEHVKLVITNAPEEEDNAFVTTACHPKDPSLGNRVVRISKEVLLEAVDTEGLEVGDEIALTRWGVIKLTKVEDGLLEAEHIPDGDFKGAKSRISWIANVASNTKVELTEFDNLITKKKLEEEDDIEDCLNPNTIGVSEVVGDAALKQLQQNDIIQLERRGYFRVDRPHLSDDKPLQLFMIPDGKKKAMSDLAGKLAHR